MEKSLKLFTYVDGVNDTPFPNATLQAEVSTFTYDAKRMGDAPSISLTLMYPQCLDDVWTEQVYATFNGEKYFVSQVPSSSYDNTDSRYKHEVNLVSERTVLNNVYFFDVVASDTENDKPVSNSSKVVFFGDIHEFVGRLNYSLQYSHLDYSVVVDEDIETEGKLMSFEDKFFSEVLQEIYNAYELPYYFDGKVIHVGHAQSEIANVFEYGVDNALLSVAKENANYKIINRCTGTGSSDNIPYYYPNLSPYGTVENLLNGEVSDKVNVVDWTRFPNCGLSGVLTYREYAQAPSLVAVKDLDDFEQVRVDFTGYLLDQAQYMWVGKTRIKLLDPSNNIQLMVSSKSAIFGGVLRYEIIDSEGFVIDEGLSWTPYNGIDLDYGTYDILIYVGVGINGVNADDYVRENVELRLDIYSAGNYSSGWELNDGGFVSLGFVGLRFNDEPKDGDTISFRLVGQRVPVVSHLMPSIYRESEGAERFYNALNDTYENPETDGEYYEFPNPYIVGKPKEHIVEFDDIKPTIKETTNAAGERIDKFVEFAYDENDSDELDQDNNFVHPYFYAKLRKFDGENGFNLFEHAIEGNPMTIAMTSGSCGSCQWTIGVDEDTQLNVIQVYEEDTTDEDGTFHAKGTLKRDENGKVLLGAAQECQNNTKTNEVWIALKKEESTFGVVMPNAEHSYRPSADDTFVILHISLPDAYIFNAEKRLSEEVIKYMSENNSEKFTFSIKFSRIYLAQNPEILAILNENVSVNVKYNGHTYLLFVSSYSYKMTENEPLPEITVELSDTLTINRSVIQNTVSTLTRRISDEIAQIRVNALVGSESLANKKEEGVFREDTLFNGNVEFAGNVASKDFTRDSIRGTGWSAYKNEQGQTVIEVDKIIARDALVVNEIIGNQSVFQKGESIITLGGCKIARVDENNGYYRCYYDNSQNTKFSGFVVGDQALCRKFSQDYATPTQHYWGLVMEATNSYVDISKTDFSGDGVPRVGDELVQLGNRNDESRQNAIVVTSTPEPSIIQYKGINNFSLPDDCIVTKISPNDNRLTGRLVIEPGSIGARNLSDLPEIIQSAIGDLDNLEFGKYNLLRNSGFTGDYLSVQLGNGHSMGEDSSMFSPSLEYWDTNGVFTQESETSESGVEVVATNGSMSQTLKAKILSGENYVFSFRGKGTTITFSVGGYTKTIELTDEYTRYVEKFVAVNSGNLFTIFDATCTMCELQLERGTVVSAWGYSMWDNQSELAYYQSLQYLSNAIKNGSTDILGGLVLTNMLMLGNYSNGQMSSVTSGVSGVYNGDDDVAFWGGGTHEQAIAAVTKYLDDPTFKPTKEELAAMAKYVVTHGGRAILNDVILRGYIYAEGGTFGNLSIGETEWGDVDLKSEITDEEGYHYQLNINPEIVRLAADHEGLDEYESVSITPLRNPDKFDLSGLLEVRARENFVALSIPSGYVAGLRHTIGNYVDTNVTLTTHTAIASGTSFQTLVLPSHSHNGTFYEIINANSSGEVAIQCKIGASITSCLNATLQSGVGTVHIDSSIRSVRATFYDGVWYLTK